MADLLVVGRAVRRLSERPPRTLPLVGVVLSAVWAAVVLAAYYPRLFQLAGYWLRLAPVPSPDPSPGFELPGRVDLVMVGHLFWALFGAALLALGTLALGDRLVHLLHLGGGSGLQAGLFAAAIGLGTTSYAVASLGLAGWLRPPVLIAIVLALALHGAVWLWQGHGRSFRPTRDQADVEHPDSDARWVAACGALLAAFLMAGFLGALLPEVEFDPLWYHLGLPHVDLAMGHVVDLPTDHASMYPQNTEMLFGVGLAWGGVTGAKLVHFLFGLLSAAATYALARHWLTRPFALLAVATFVGAPLVMWELTTADVDLAAAFYATLGVVELQEWRDRRERLNLMRSALMFGLALATKHLDLILLPGAVVLIGLIGLRDAWRLRSWRTKALLDVPAFLGVSLALGFPWYLRAFLATGNPVFPVLYSVFGAPASRWNALNALGLAQTNGFRPSDPMGIVTLPWTVTVSPEIFQGSIGPLYLIALLPVLFAVPGVLRRVPIVPLAVVAGFLIAWASPLWTLETRLLIPILPILALLASGGLEYLLKGLERSGWNRAARCVPWACLLVLVLSFPAFIPWHGSHWIGNSIRGLDLGAIVDRQEADRYLALHVHGYEAIQYANRELPPGTRILTFAEALQLYSDHQLILHYAALAQPATWASQPGDDATVLRTLDALGVTAVIVDWQRHDVLTTPIAITSDSFRERYFTFLYQADNVSVFAFHH